MGVGRSGGGAQWLSWWGSVAEWVGAVAEWGWGTVAELVGLGGSVGGCGG